MVFPVCRFVYEAVTAPVKRNVVDPSAALRTLVNSLLTSGRHPDLEPAERRGQGEGPGGPGELPFVPPPPARAGEAVTAPASMPSSAPSATITPTRLIDDPSKSCLSWLRVQPNRCCYSGAGNSVRVRSRRM